LEEIFFCQSSKGAWTLDPQVSFLPVFSIITLNHLKSACREGPFNNQRGNNQSTLDIGYYAGLGTGIVKGMKKESFSNSNSSFHEQAEESQFTIHKFEESCHL